ncbi:glycosyltransferase family 2 protein [Billgrantia montanilacus]|uniref:Glycosyltransferase n=1 Tax=Billgrantia montanilacus TaxID=2282305 RepID=A0A368U383_9GAMM|nr:glycosyltransferase [Halomonas montanilacus]RCV91016.1 glycosyltransferase [Halomonas montanilacus]
MKLKFSVIIPVYNGEMYLKYCLDSILLAAKNHAVEVIVIDDGSTDSSAGIAQKYSESFESFLFITQNNKGPSAARNVGLGVANGEYVTFVDCDDIVFNNYFFCLENACRKNPDIIVFGYQRVFLNGEKQSFPTSGMEQYISPGKFLDDVIGDRELFWFTWSKAFRRSALSDLRFDERLHLGEDTIFNMYAVLSAKYIIRIPEIIYSYYQVEGSLSSPRYKPLLLENMQVHFDTRLDIQNKAGEITDEGRRDIRDYYMLHILPWLISNAIKISDFSAQIDELKRIRNSELVETCLSWKGRRGTRGMNIIQLLFKARMLRLLRSLLVWKSRIESSKKDGVRSWSIK